MLDNELYNLMAQIVEENKSLWRIEHMYLKDSQEEDHTAFWDRMKKDKAEHIAELKELIKNHLNK
jgi:hypothetical protein